MNISTVIRPAIVNNRQHSLGLGGRTVRKLSSQVKNCKFNELIAVNKSFSKSRNVAVSPFDIRTNLYPQKIVDSDIEDISLKDLSRFM